MKPRASHIFNRDQHDHYVEEQWTSHRLFDVEEFADDIIIDPACGWGRILNAALQHGHSARGSDIVDRQTGIGKQIKFKQFDFLTIGKLPWPLRRQASIVSNPPFGLIQEFAAKALTLPLRKVVLLFPLRRLPAARWLEASPLERVWLLTPRPSMPSGEHIANGGYVGGGTADFCWLAFRRGYVGRPTLNWLHREKSLSFADRTARAHHP